MWRAPTARSVAAMRLLHSSPRLAAAELTLAAVLGAPSTAFAADAVYGGGARSGQPIVLKSDAESTTLRSLTIGWIATCDDGSFVPGGGTLTPTKATPGFQPSSSELMVSRNAKGRFHGVQLANRDLGSSAAAITVNVVGKLEPGRASGTIKVEVAIIDKATNVAVTTCRVNDRFSVSREAGIVYGGTTSQGTPIVLRLHADRSRVSDVFVSWVAPCAPGGAFHVSDALVNFPVKSSGAFGNRFEAEFPADGGANRHYAYAFSGKLSKISAKGKLQVKVDETDAAGAATYSCDTGAMTWKVTSS